MAPDGARCSGGGVVGPLSDPMCEGEAGRTFAHAVQHGCCVDGDAVGLVQELERPARAVGQELAVGAADVGLRRVLGM